MPTEVKAISGGGRRKCPRHLLVTRPSSDRALACRDSDLTRAVRPSQGQQITFPRVDDWLREPPSMPAEDKAEDALVRHHLSAIVPADVAVLWAWSGVYVRRLRVILDRLREELVEVDQGDRHAYLLKKDLRNLEKAATDRGAVRLLPSFDPFLQGHRRRDHLV